MGFFREKNGDKSMMRLLAFMSFIVGTFVMTAGILLVGLEEGAVTIVIVGGALSGGGQAFKSLQKMFEK